MKKLTSKNTRKPTILKGLFRLSEEEILAFIEATKEKKLKDLPVIEVDIRFVFKKGDN